MWGQFRKINAISHQINYQTLRWKKPRWLPTAKSKLFKVPPRRVPPPEEEVEIRRLYNKYRTANKSLVNFLDQKYNVKYQKSTDPEELQRVFEEDFARCKAINDEWNSQQKIVREKFFTDRLEEQLQRAEKQIEDDMIQKEKKMEEIESIVKQLKEESKNFIKREDIDKVIDAALENVVDYNYALHPSGQKIFGRENNNLEVDKQEKGAVKQ